MASWFICHSKLDPAVARRIVDRLTGAGVGSLYLSHHPVHGNEAGVLWKPELFRQLRSSVGVVFLASRHAVESKWCAAELGIARMLGHHIIVYRMDSDADLDLVSDLHWVDPGDEDDPYGPLANAILAATGSPADKLPWKPSRSPYPGLEAFSEEYAAVFFGRDEKIDQVVDLLSPALPQAGRFVAIVGPSGSGKSSLLRAGVLPRLSCDRWVVPRPMTPGSRPLHSLARALLEARGRPVVAEDVETMAKVVTEGGSDALVGIVDGLTDGRQRVLLVIDQAEELSARTGPRQRKAFLDLLRGGLRPESPLWILATVRSEFLSPAPDRAGLADAIHDTVLVEPLSRERLPEVIERPARRARLEIPSGLVARMVDETVGGDALPLLAGMLEQLYREVGSGGTVTVTDYEQLGGVVGAVQREADRRAAECARRGVGPHVMPTLLKLTNLDPSGLPTRRRVDRAGLTADEGVVASVFVEARLLTTHTTPDGRPTVEVAHEALLRRWPPLAREIEEQRRALGTRSELERLANDWDRSRRGEGLERDESYLLHGGRLDAIERWLDANPAGYDLLGELERRFLEESRALALRTRDAARRSTRVATSRSLLFRAESMRGTSAGTSLLLGIAAMQVNPSSEARASLVKTLLETRYRATLTGHGLEVSAIAFHPGGGILVTGSHDPALTFWDVTDPGRPHKVSTAQGHAGTVWAVAFSPDGGLMASGSPDSTIVLWDVSNPARPRQLSTISGDHTWVRSLALSRDGRRLVAGHWDNTGRRDDRATLCDVADPEQPRHLSDLVSPRGDTGPVRAVTFCGDDRLTATADDSGTIELWDTSEPASPRVLATLSEHANSVWTLAYDRSGKRLLSGSSDRTAILWNLTDPNRPVRMSNLDGHAGAVRAAAFSPDGSLALTGSWDNTATLWRLDEPARPVRVAQLGGHSQPVHAVAFSPTGSCVATASDDGTAVVWDVAARAEPVRLAGMIGHTAGVPAVAFSPDGRTMASGSEDGSAVVWDVADPTRPLPLTRLSERHGTVFALAYGRGGRLLVTGHADVEGTVFLWDMTRPHKPSRLCRLTADGNGVAAVSVSPDGATVAVGCNTGSAQLWDVSDPASPRLITTLDGYRGPVRGVPFAPGGAVLVTASTDASGDTVTVWDITDPARPVRRAGMTDHNSVYAAAFSPDGHTLALAEEGRKTTLWDLTDSGGPRRLATVREHASSVFTIGFSPDGRMIATGGYDRTAIVLDVTDLRQPRRLVTLAESPNGVGAVAFSPDGRTLAVSGGDSPQLWDVTRLAAVVAKPLAVALEITGRGLSDDEWERYVPELPVSQRLAGPGDGQA